ncbi:retrovirus-related pol polyprotein from transposon TNT 1-94 [Tanacetum coccineum]
MFYTSQEEIALNVFCRDQVKPLLNELLDHFDGFQNLFQMDIKEMKDAFEQNDVYLDEIERQNDFLKDQLLEVSLKHDIELCVLLSHECVDKSLHDELEQVKKKSLEIQEARMKMVKMVVQIVLWVVDSGCSKHMTGDRALLRNFVEKFMGTVHFGNDNFAAITGYDLEVAFRSKTCYVRNLEGDDLLTSGRDSNLYTISISDMAASSPICLMSKATSTKSWLWHRRLSHLKFVTINDLTKLDLVDGLPKFKYEKDHLCSACKRGKSKKASHPPKLIPSDHSKLELLHMDLCGPMRVASVNGKKYILVIVDDFSRFTWVYFLRSKDETPEIIKKFITQAQLNYKAKVYKIQTDNGTEFKNATLKAHYEKLGIMQQFSIARTPQQNGVVERRNHTLVEAARTMLIFSRLPEFLWAEAVATACFTQNCWIESMQDELNQFERLQVWELVPRPEGKNVIALKWLWKNKCDAENIMVRNKSRLVAKGYKQEGGIDFGVIGSCSSRRSAIFRGKLDEVSSKKQICTAMSTVEAEYVSLSACLCSSDMDAYSTDFDFGLDYKIYHHGTTTTSAAVIKLNCNPPNKRFDIMDANKKDDLENFWHTLREDGSKYRLKFMLDKKELTFTLDDFRTIFHLPQANDNNHASFVSPPSFSDMPWQTLCKILSKCLTTRVTGWDQPPLEKQEQGWDANTTMDDYRRDEAYGAL